VNNYELPLWMRGLANFDLHVAPCASSGRRLEIASRSKSAAEVVAEWEVQLARWVLRDPQREVELTAPLGRGDVLVAYDPETRTKGGATVVS
jgi:hypothetical protein